ncbi:helix-turn-helix domain-containing protein [Lysinibacillus antri]|uniref:Recombinase RecQ n=1 Tax=Lysinibacillus antri TaxID=2498145 RepID=A0A3S0P5B1_9BACI|nr:helix-turn-helix domain-containing protein [Lysinibacillus antri]RUL55063.1 recombinase RecQ [Lysinibacillus antri]
MIFRQILLQIFHKFKQERTISAPFHLLRGKRSGQTIQDVGIFQLHMYFGILPKLSRKTYDEEISKLIEEQYMTVSDEGYYILTAKAKEMNQTVDLPFNGWQYRGNEHLFFARLSLVIQSLSHKAYNQMSFLPIQKDPQVQEWVRKFLISHHYQERDLQQQLYEEIIVSLEQAPIEQHAKVIVMKRLTGYKIAGYTWQQLSIYENKSEMDIQFIYIACLHAWLNGITDKESQFPLLAAIAEQVRVAMPLSGSAYQTAQLFQQGYSIEQISQYRKLKRSTIEDHIVEIAMNNPRFDIRSFITEEEIHQVVNAVDDYNTRKLKILHEVMPNLSYFQIRLVLARGETV